MKEKFMTMRNFKNKTRRLMSLAIILVLVLSSNVAVSAKETSEFLEDFGDLIEMIMNSYAGGDVTEEELFEAAMDGMASILDDYSVFYNDEEAQTFIDSLSSEYVGIGVRIKMIADQVVITEVFEGGAAYDAGLQANDIISKVSGEDASLYELNELVSKIVGDEGTYVTIEFLRAGEAFTLELERRFVHIPSVTTLELDQEDLGLTEEQAGKIHSIAVSSFKDETDDDFIEEVNKATELGVDYLLIDMRENGGGYLSSAVHMLETVVPEGNIVTLISKEGTNTTYESELDEVPFQVVLLVNENSASASEIFAAAIKENGDGVVIGEQTFGKGVAQNIYHIGDDYLMKMTTSEFFSPNMNKINTIGVEPDVIVDTPEYVYSDKRFYKSDVDEEIINVEGMLKFMGYFNEEPDDTYTESTFYAVKSFQADKGLYAYGVCDYTTQSKINSEYMLAVENNDVQLQAAIDWIVEDTQK